MGFIIVGLSEVKRLSHESLSSKEAITLSNKLGIGFCED